MNTAKELIAYSKAGKNPSDGFTPSAILAALGVSATMKSLPQMNTEGLVESSSTLLRHCLRNWLQPKRGRTHFSLQLISTHLISHVPVSESPMNLRESTSDNTSFLLQFSIDKASLSLLHASVTYADKLDMRSFWAIAGFAVVVIFTYRALRSPNGSQRRQPKRQSPSHNNEDSLPSGVSSSSQDSRTENATDEFFPPANVTLGQIVRRRLSDGRKITCRLLGVILEENTPEELQLCGTFI
ncbi:hypothetical protein L2E82_50550 [Cichorium intybus]|nr:hypothetical protein L2E82_50550 [Cichorium intybus]